jgi:hypothetical protein
MQMTTYRIDDYDYQAAKPGEVYRRWLFSAANGDEYYRSQKIYPDNPCRINVPQILEDYANKGQWGGSYNNSCSMPLACARIGEDMSTTLLSLDEVLKLGTLED